MALVNRKSTKNSLPNDYWKEVNQKAQNLITEILKEKLPFANSNPNLNLELDADYRNLCVMWLYVLNINSMIYLD